MAFLMMVSVMRHTESTVKFWFIQNFLSPSFKAFIPHLAQGASFLFFHCLLALTLIPRRVRLRLRARHLQVAALASSSEGEAANHLGLQNPFPRWLVPPFPLSHYSVFSSLFIYADPPSPTVLFPLELERVIFVDSDQIVRTDLKELIDMDIKGAPYAYTPMGDDPARPEMDRFRFWKTGCVVLVLPLFPVFLTFPPTQILGEPPPRKAVPHQRPLPRRPQAFPRDRRRRQVRFFFFFLLCLSFLKSSCSRTSNLYNLPHLTRPHL
jgi:hypothetical protein